MAEPPETSVVMPVRNGERHILAAAASVLDQLGPNDELLVVDDGSSDRTRALLDFGDPRVVVLDGDGRGAAAARNIGIARTRGEFVAFLDHDDLWPKGRHLAMRAALQASPVLDAAIGRLNVKVEPDGIPGHWLAMNGQHVPWILMTALYRRRIIERTGPFDTSLRFGEDTDYYLRLKESGVAQILCDQDALIYRRHGNNTTNNSPPHAELMKIIIRRQFLRKYAASCDVVRVEE